MAKTSKNRRDFGQLQTLIANISGWQYRKSEKQVINYNPLTLGDKNVMNFG